MADTQTNIIQPFVPQSAPMPENGFAQESLLDLSRGSQFLFRFPSTRGNTIYCYDRDDNIYVPFQSTMAFHAAMGTDPQTAFNEGMIHDLTTPPLHGTFVPDEYGISENGTISPQGLAYIQGKLRTPVSSSSGQGGYSGKGGPADGKGGTPTFTSYGKFANNPNNPTVYGITSDNKLVALETWDQFTSSGGDAGKIATLPADTNVSNAIPYTQYAASLNPVANNPSATSSSTGSTAGSTADNPGGYGRYGQPQDANLDTAASEQVPGMLSLFVNSGVISPSTFDSVTNNATLMADYIHAWAYGGYDNATDLYMDVKARELGITPTAISTTIPASQYHNDPQYAQAKNNSQLAMPPKLLQSNPLLAGSALMKMDDNAFKTLVTPIDITSPAIQQQATSMANEAADFALQDLNATTDSEKSVANQNYQDWKNYIQNTYGFALANDATSAWGQLQQMASQAEQGYTVNSGALNEAQDMALNQRRTYDAQLRTSKATQEDMQQRNYLLSTGTTDEINAFVAANPQKAIDWGLKPSTDLTNWLNNLSTKYPDLTPDKIQAIKNMYVDPNTGNMRSTLYQNLYRNQYQTTYGAIPTASSEASAGGSIAQNINILQGKNTTAAQIAGEKYDTTDSAKGLIGDTSSQNPPAQNSQTPATSNPNTQSNYNPSTQSTYNAVTNPGGSLQMPNSPLVTGSNSTSQSQSAQSSQQSQPFQGLQMPTTTSTKPTFTSYVKTANSPTVYGVTASGQNVAFENSDQFLNSGGSWNKIQNVNSVNNPVNYSQYKPPGS